MTYKADTCLGAVSVSLVFDLLRLILYVRVRVPTSKTLQTKNLDIRNSWLFRQGPTYVCNLPF